MCLIFNYLKILCFEFIHLNVVLLYSQIAISLYQTDIKHLNRSVNILYSV